MSLIFRACLASVYHQWLQGQSAPARIELNAAQLQRFHAERAEGCRELGVIAPEGDAILGIPILHSESSAGELVTMDGNRIALLLH